MKKSFFLLILVSLCFNFSVAYSNVKSYKKGKGDLIVSENTANVLEYYFSGGKMGKFAESEDPGWKPGLIAISIDGQFYNFFTQPKWLQDHQIMSGNYAGRAVKKCEQMAVEYNVPQKCFLFAKGYKIVWDNGTTSKERRIKRSDIKNGRTIEILTNLGFYLGSYNNQSNDTKETNNLSTVNNSEKGEDVVSKIKELKQLFDEGILSEEEFEKAKKKILK